MGVFAWLLGGLIIGAIARTLVKGRFNLGCIGTTGLGMLGSLVGGTVWNAFRGQGMTLTAGGFITSVFGAVLVLVLVRLLGRAPDQQFPR